MAARRRICFVLPSLNGGGAERAAVQILNGLDPDRWDRSMFLFAREGPYLADVDPAIRIAAADTASRWGRSRTCSPAARWWGLAASIWCGGWGHYTA